MNATRKLAIVLLVTLGVHGCRGEPSRRTDDAVDFCAELATLTDQLLACLSPDEFLYDSYRKVGEMARSDRSDPEVAPHIVKSCASYLETFGRSPGEYPPPCNIKPLSPRVRAALEALHARRTTIPMTGDPRIDEDSRWWMAQRDRVCACKDVACAETARNDIDANIRKASPGRSPAVVEAEQLVYDELSRCHRRLEQEAMRRLIDAERDAGH